jgi:uncharacterized protein YdaU (DUF1376 family)
MTQLQNKQKQDRMAWFKFDPASFNNDISGLPHEAAGIYIKMMNLYWITGNKPISIDSIFRRKMGIKSSSEEESLKIILEELFTEMDCGGFIHRDLDLQLDSIKKNSDLQRERVNARYKKKAGNSSSTNQERSTSDEDDEDF